MAYVVIEPSGCCINNEKIQIRFCMYLEPNDYGYEKYYADYYLIPKGVKMPVDPEQYQSWLAKLPKKKVNTPFHHHFIYVDHLMSDDEIMNIGEALLNEAYIKWSCDQPLDLDNDALPVTSNGHPQELERRLSVIKLRQHRRAL